MKTGLRKSRAEFLVCFAGLKRTVFAHDQQHAVDLAVRSIRQGERGRTLPQVRNDWIDGGWHNVQVEVVR